MTSILKRANRNACKECLSRQTLILSRVILSAMTRTVAPRYDPSAPYSMGICCSSNSPGPLLQALQAFGAKVISNRGHPLRHRRIESERQVKAFPHISRKLREESAKLREHVRSSRMWQIIPPKPHMRLYIRITGHDSPEKSDMVV